MEELQKQIIAVQLIQELIVDVMDTKGIIARSEFEDMLKVRVDKFNKDIEKYAKENSKVEKVIPYISNIVGEA